MTRKSLVVGLVVALVALGATASWAAPFAYATDTGTNLYTVDLTNGTATLIGSTGIFFESIALAADGSLYGASSVGLFYGINKTTGAPTLIGDTGLGNIEGLDYNGSTLLATNFAGTPSVYSIDPVTGMPTLVTTFSTATSVVRSMAVKDPTTIVARTDGPAGPSLHSIDLLTGTTTFVGPLPTFFAAMDYFGGTLYGLDDSGNLFTINDGTAATTLVASTGSQFWLSMTTFDSAAVPEPASLALLAGGLAFLVTRRRRA